MSGRTRSFVELLKDLQFELTIDDRATLDATAERSVQTAQFDAAAIGQDSGGRGLEGQAWP
jgi:hypothetical protein